MTALLDWLVAQGLSADEARRLLASLSPERLARLGRLIEPAEPAAGMAGQLAAIAMTEAQQTPQP